MGFYISWSDTMKGYNERYKTDYTDLKVWLSDLYTKTKSANTMVGIIGIDATTIVKKMRALGIPIQKRGGYYFSRAVKEHAFLTIPPLRMKNMILPEIAKETGISCNYAAYLTVKYNRSYLPRRAPKTKHLKPKILKIFTSAFPGDQSFEKYITDMLNHRNVKQLRKLYKDLTENGNNK